MRKAKRKLKILFVIGTRPEALKMAPLILAARKVKEFRAIVCLTAQHRQMADQVLKIFGIKPDYDLNLMTSNQSLGEITAGVVTRLGKTLDAVKPDVLVVQGDTTTAFASALCAYYHKIRVVHIEAGLRSHDKYFPFPEEINRKLITHIADDHIAPTGLAKKNLLAEGIPGKSVYVTGNSIVDALLYIHYQNKRSKFVSKHTFKSKKIILVTAHRRESFGKPFREICGALKEISRRLPDFEIVYPVHLNPRVDKVVRGRLSGQKRIHLLPPLDYREFVSLMSRSHLILTDSGGIQEEAPTFGVPVLVMRNVTERQEAVKLGLAKLIGTDQKTIVRETVALVNRMKKNRKREKLTNPFGDGKASLRFIRFLKSIKTAKNSSKIKTDLKR